LKKLTNLSLIKDQYDTFIIDLWGVMHNGIELNKSAIEAVEKLILNKKKVVFLSNAPRPVADVVKFLKKLKMEEKHMQNIVTSGQAAMEALQSNSFGKNYYHLGPEKDNSIFSKIKINKTELEKSEFIVCTGLLENKMNNLDFYKKILINQTSKKLICTNPDLIVERGKKKEYCAGMIAKIFEELGGEVVYFGKPYKEIYQMCFSKNDKVIAVGDNLRTDIKGANNMKIDSIFIGGGIHSEEFKNEKELYLLEKKYKVKLSFFQEYFHW